MKIIITQSRLQYLVMFLAAPTIVFVYIFIRLDDNAPYNIDFDLIPSWRDEVLGADNFCQTEGSEWHRICDELYLKKESAFYFKDLKAIHILVWSES